MPKLTQYIIGILTIVLISLICYYAIDFIGYQVTALILLLAVSILAMIFDIKPVLVAAILSATIWNFFFIPPIFTFHIAKSEDAILFLMYFVVVMLSAAFTYKIREFEKKVRDKEEKENAIKLYKTLLNSLSHELKTPIATILGAVDTLQGNTFISEENKKILITQIEIATIRLNKEVENLLSISRLGSGVIKLNYDWCDINDLLNIILNKIEPDLNNHNIEIHINDNMPLVKLDSVIMQQVIFNLLYNAVQYTPPHTTVTIDVYMDQDDCVFIIKDNGQGISEEEQANIFEMFYRLPLSKTGGSGLGLSIVKGFVEAHHGSIMLNSKIGSGSNFVIKIPVETSYVNKIKND